MKKLLALLLLISSISIFAGRATPNSNSDFESRKMWEEIPKEIVITKNSEIKKEILEISNYSKKEFKVTITIPDTDTGIEALQYFFLDDNYKYATTSNIFNSLTPIEQEAFSNSLFIEKIFEQNGSSTYRVKNLRSLLYIGVVYKMKDNKQINSIGEILDITFEK